MDAYAHQTFVWDALPGAVSYVVEGFNSANEPLPQKTVIEPRITVVEAFDNQTGIVFAIHIAPVDALGNRGEWSTTTPVNILPLSGMNIVGFRVE